MPEKVKIQVAPNIEMNVEVTAQNMADIQVAAMEEELEKLEKQFAAELKDDEEELEKSKKALDKGVDDFGRDFTDELEKELIPVMRKFGFKGLRATFSATFQTNDDDKVYVSTGLAIEGKRTDDVCTGGIRAGKVVQMSPRLKALVKANKDAEAKVKLTTDRLLKIKENLGNVAKLERKARAEMAKNLLQTTDSGRALLGMLNARKALPLKD